MKLRYNKLVRDKIPDIIKERGNTPITHIALDFEYQESLRDKLVEEAREFLDTKNSEELADIFEVIDAIIEAADFTREDVLRIQKQKAKERGKFQERIILEEVK